MYAEIIYEKSATGENFRGMAYFSKKIALKREKGLKKTRARSPRWVGVDIINFPKNRPIGGLPPSSFNLDSPLSSEIFRWGRNLDKRG